MKYLLCLCVLCFSGCDDNSSSIDATINTSDKYVYDLRDFCSKENIRISISQAVGSGKEILKFEGDGIVFTPCPGEKVRTAYSSLTAEDVEEFRERYRSRSSKSE